MSWAPEGEALPLPRLASTMVVRPRLQAALETPAALVLVRAPLGFGKTTLVAQWLHARDGGAADVVGWLRVTSDCTSADRFWAAAWHALRDAGLAGRPGAVEGMPVQQLHRSLCSTRTRVLLVVDGFERITDPDIERDLRDLLHDCPALQVVVCLRGSQHLRSYAAPDLTTVELSGADLVFTEDEVAQLLCRLGVPADPDRAARIHAEAGGWPELTYAVAHAIAGGADEADALGAVTTDYLRSRLLPELDDPGARATVLASSVVDSLSVELLTALIDWHQGEPPLRGLQSAGLLASTDGETYHWPAAARRAFGAELAHTDPNAAATLHDRAARWYLDHGAPGSALDHALTARQWQLATEVIDTSWRWLWRHRQDALARAFNQVPLDVLASSPVALALRDWRAKVPDELFVRAIPHLPDDPDELTLLASSPAVFETVDTGNVLLVSLRKRAEYATALRYADKLETIMKAARWGPGERLADAAASTSLQIAITRLLADDRPGAHRAFLRAHDIAADVTDDAYVGRDAAGKLALAHALAGDARRAGEWLRRHIASRLTVEGEWFQHTVSSTAACARLLVALERLEVGDAAAAVEADGPSEPDEFWAYFAYADALYALHAGHAAAGLATLHQHPRPSTGMLLNPVTPATGPLLAAIEADLLMALGHANAARAVLTGTHAGHPSLRVGTARLALLSGDAETAAVQTHDLRWMQSATPRWQQEILLIQAIAHHRLGQPHAATDALRRALATAASLDAWRAFTTVPRAELMALAQALPPAECAPLNRLATLPEAFPSTVTLIELSTRERTILEHLAAGLRHSQLAQRLYISNNTVKYHVRGLYRKLGATSRAEALTRAQALGLLPAKPTG